MSWEFFLSFMCWWFVPRDDRHSHMWKHRFELDALVLKGGCQYHPGGKENTAAAHHAVGRRLKGLQLAGDGAIRK